MEAVKWIGGGVLAVIAYVVISNTLWLLDHGFYRAFRASTSRDSGVP